MLTALSNMKATLFDYLCMYTNQLELQRYLNLPHFGSLVVDLATTSEARKQIKQSTLLYWSSIGYV